MPLQYGYIALIKIYSQLQVQLKTESYSGIRMGKKYLILVTLVFWHCTTHGER